MLIDIFSSENYVSYNIKLAHIAGLNASIYCSEILNIYSRAVKKNKLIDDKYVKLDRKYIYNRTTLSIEDQLICDINLSKIDIIVKDNDNPDIIKLDIKLLVSLLSGEDIDQLEQISKKLKVKKPKGVKVSARQRKIAELRDSIQCSNYELLTALRDWVDAIYSKPGGYLSAPVIKIFQDTLNNYTNGDLDLALRIVHIATAQSYRDCQWAINVYEKDQAIARKQASINAGAIRFTEQKKSMVEELSDEVF